ncbi:elongation factor Ts [Pseudomaricurvus alkylphenolicus]|jgi:elongation factor Ts|uniref:translation elongation factor Ts n=1 Tax=Pseudomaricurvus alkylphenolicus TaxID=1306991 RepID=UPI0014249E8A|nr:translation elongation factor Ts [Pseudomaricurvus alkylphenolicus]NIB39853.1 elongation factor Ts [Pseudomaricurvus alkylphenolicus]
MAAVSASMVKELRERTGLGMMECKKALKEADGDINVAIENLRKASGLKAEKKAGRTAAEGVVAVKVADDSSYAVLVEVNSETDFAARDENFLGFVNTVVEKAFEAKNGDVEALMAAGLEDTRQALVQKIGENIGVRRIEVLEGGVLGAYVHSNNRIAVLAQLDGGTTEVAKDVAMHVAAVNPRVINPDDMPEEELNKEKEIIKAQPDMEGKPENIVEKMMVGRINKFLKENSLTEQPFVKDPDVTVGKLAKNADATISNFVRFEVGEGIEVEEADFAAEVAAQVEAANK